MSWLQRIFAQETKQSATAASMIISPGQPVWSDRNYASFADEGYRKNVIAYQSINRIGEAISSIPIMVWQNDAEMESHPAIDLLKRPNPSQSRAAFLQAVVGFYLISGNAYIERVDIRNEPRELYTHRPDRMTVVPDASGSVAAYEYRVGAKKVVWRTDQFRGKSPILHMKSFHPLNDWYGMSPIEAGAHAIDQHNESMGWLQSLLQNGAQPSGALTVPENEHMTDEQYVEFKRQIEERYSGAQNAGRPMLLEGGMTWQQMGMSPMDMAIIDAKYSSARDVALAFGVPPMLLGIPGDNTYSNYKEARLAFWEDTVIPLMDFIAAELSHWLASVWPGIALKPDYETIPAIAEKKAELWRMANESTDLTINERRAIKGYAPVSNGDTMFVDATKLPLDQSLQEPEGENVIKAMERFVYGPQAS